jgi:hypothetical protein
MACLLLSSQTQNFNSIALYSIKFNLHRDICPPLPPSRIETSASVLPLPSSPHTQTGTSTWQRPHVEVAGSIAVGRDRAARQRHRPLCLWLLHLS